MYSTTVFTSLEYFSRRHPFQSGVKAADWLWELHLLIGCVQLLWLCDWLRHRDLLKVFSVCPMWWCREAQENSRMVFHLQFVLYHFPHFVTETCSRTVFRTEKNRNYCIDSVYQSAQLNFLCSETHSNRILCSMCPLYFTYCRFKGIFPAQVQLYGQHL